MAPAEFQQYLSSLGIDPNLFRNFSANDIKAEQMTGYAPTMGDYGQGDPMYQNVGLSGLQSLYNNYSGNLAMMPQVRMSAGDRFGSMDKNYGMDFNANDGTFSLKVKSGDKEAAQVPYKQDANGQWVPDWEKAKAIGWDTNRAVKTDLMGLGTVLGAAALGTGAAYGGLFGPEAAAAFNGAGAAGSAAAPAISGAAETMWPGLASSGGNYASMIGAGAAPTGAGLSSGTLAGGLGGSLGGFGNYMALAPEVASGLQGWGTQTGNVAMGGEASPWGSVKDVLGTGGKVAGAAGSLLGGGSSTGSGLGGLLGGLAGYYDAKSQPDSLTIKSEIDPRLAQYAYGADGNGGIAGAANNLMQQQIGGANPIVDAGKQISGMANTLPGWNSLVDQSKTQWDANPFIQQQQKAITDTATRNLLENVMPNIGSEANYAGGYGGSRQGVAQALAMSRMNQDLAPALTGLASNAWESSQNRALNSAQSAGTYGLNNQAQQAGLLGTGANLQANGAWNPIQNATNVMRGLPGNTSQTQPLFNNPWAGAIGGASVGSQIGGGTNWGDIFKGIGDIGQIFKNWG
jgi:hypothetical protein